MHVALAIERENPTRRLDWRLCAALRLADTSSRSNCAADDLIQETVRFLRQLRRRQTARGCKRSQPVHSALNTAIEISVGPPATRAILEAGILTGESSDATGTRVGIGGPAVDVYEGLFYNVRDRLSARAWIQLAAIDRVRAFDSAECRRHRLLRKLAYRGGPVVLNFALSGLQMDGSNQPADPAAARLFRMLELLEVPGLSWEVLMQVSEISTSFGRSSALQCAAAAASTADYSALQQHQDSASPTHSNADDFALAIADVA